MNDLALKAPQDHFRSAVQQAVEELKKPNKGKDDAKGSKPDKRVDGVRAATVLNNDFSERVDVFPKNSASQALAPGKKKHAKKTDQPEKTNGPTNSPKARASAKAKERQDVDAFADRAPRQRAKWQRQRR